MSRKTRFCSRTRTPCLDHNKVWWTAWRLENSKCQILISFLTKNLVNSVLGLDSTTCLRKISNNVFLLKKKFLLLRILFFSVYLLPVPRERKLLSCMTASQLELHNVITLETRRIVQESVWKLLCIYISLYILQNIYVPLFIYIYIYIQKYTHTYTRTHVHTYIE